MITGFGSVAVLVSDSKKSKEWFRDKLGFEIRDDSDHWVVVAPRGSTTGIHVCQSKKLEPGNQGILFYADDVEATYKELVSKGVKFSRELKKAEWDENMKYAMIQDPDGNEYWLMQRED